MPICWYTAAFACQGRVSLYGSRGLKYLLPSSPSQKNFANLYCIPSKCSLFITNEERSPWRRTREVEENSGCWLFTYILGPKWILLKGAIGQLLQVERQSSQGAGLKGRSLPHKLFHTSLIRAIIWRKSLRPTTLSLSPSLPPSTVFRLWLYNAYSCSPLSLSPERTVGAVGNFLGSVLLQQQFEEMDGPVLQLHFIWQAKENTSSRCDGRPTQKTWREEKPPAQFWLLFLYVFLSSSWACPV